MSADASKSKSSAITKAKKANLTLGVTRIDRALRKSRVCKNVGSAAAIYATALCEEIVDDILVRAGEDATHKKSKRIAVCHLISSVRSNPDTAMLLCNFGFGSAIDARKAIDFILDDKAKKERKEAKVARTATREATTADLVSG